MGDHNKCAGAENAARDEPDATRGPPDATRGPPDATRGPPDATRGPPEPAPTTLVPVFDGHNDALLRLHLRGGDARPFIDGRPGGHLDLPRARQGGFAGGFFAVFVPTPKEDPLRVGDAAAAQDRAVGAQDRAVPYAMPMSGELAADYALPRVLAMAGLLFRIERESAGALTVARNSAQVDACLAERRIAAILHLEGAEAVLPDLTNLEALHDLGVRSIGPVWSRPNTFGHGVPFRFPSTPDTGPGLTAAGRALVRSCAELGVLIDLAHLNLRGFFDVAELDVQPLVVTHSAAHALTPTARNLTDQQLDAIAQTGGVLGLNLHVGDLRADGRFDPNTPLARWFEHLDHVTDRIGIDAVAIGSDFDGAMMPRELADAGGLQLLISGLAERGYDTHDVHKIAYGNWRRVLGRVLG